MPNLPTHPLGPDQVPNQYIVNFWKADDIKLLNGLPEYIESQKHCSGANPENKISWQYSSKSGGAAILSGIFDRRILAWISNRVPREKGSVESNARLPLTAIQTDGASPWFAIALYCWTYLLIIHIIGHLQE